MAEKNQKFRLYDRNKILRSEVNDMRKNSKHPKPSCGAEPSVRTGFALGLLTAVLLILCLAVWLRSDPRKNNASAKAEPSSSVSGQSPFQQPASRNSANGNRIKSRELSPAAQAEQHRLGGIWAAFLAAQALTDPVEETAVWNRLMYGMTKELAVELLSGLSPDDLKGAAARRLFDFWATANPSETAVWAQSQGDPETRQSFMNVAALRWAVTDLKAAATWARNLPEGESRTEILAAVGSEAVRSDPLEALRLGIELPTGTAQSDLIQRAAAEWASTDRDSALKWAQQIEDEDLRQRVTEHVAVASAEQDPAGAATIVLQQLSPGEGQDRAVVSIIQRWVQTDPAIASAWVSEFPENALGRDAMDNLVNLWADRDLVASGNWLLTLREGALRNAGVLAYSRVLMRTDAALAQRWALSVTGGQ